MKAKKVMALVLCAAMVSGLAATTVMAAPEDQFDGLTANEAYEFPMMVKSFQATYWEAAMKGMDKAAEELGVSCRSAMVSRITLRLLLLSLMDFCMSSMSFFNALTLDSSSSISRRRPRRLLLFLKEPPDMEPPGLKDSPSTVTMRRLCLYFLAMAMAWSI